MPRGTLLTLVCLVHFAALLPLVREAAESPNDASRFGAAVSLAAGGGYGLAAPYAGTLDRALRDDGVFISDKPPLLNVLAGGVAWMRLRAGGGEASLSGTYRLVTILLSLVPATLTLGALGALLLRLGRRPIEAALAALLLGLTTSLTVYAITFANHALAALLAMGTVILLPARDCPGRPWLLGLVAGTLPLIDVPAGSVIGLVTLGHVALTLRRVPWGFLAGAAIPAVVGLGLNRVLTHTWLPVYFHGEMYEYEGSVWRTLPSGLPPYPVRVFERLIGITVGFQGFVLLWPVSLFALAGLRRALRAPASPREESIARWTAWSTSLCFAALALNPSALGNDLGGGYGLRWAIPLLAPLALFVVQPPRPDSRGGTPLPLSRGRRALLGICCLWSLGAVALGLVNPWPANTVSRFAPLHSACLLIASARTQPVTDAVIALTAREPALGHFDLGMAHFHAQRFAEAQREYQRALASDTAGNRRQFDPNLARYYLGIALTELRLTGPAREVYERLLADDPGNVGARNNFAILLLRSGRPTEALAQVRESLRRDPGSGTARRIEAEALTLLAPMASPESP